MTAPRLTVVHFGPVCGESPDGYNLVTVHGGRGLEDAAPRGALVLVGQVITGLESMVVSHATRLPKGAPVLAFRPCHATSAFWQRVDWVPPEEVVDVDAVSEACLHHDPGAAGRLLRSLGRSHQARLESAIRTPRSTRR